MATWSPWRQTMTSSPGAILSSSRSSFGMVTSRWARPGTAWGEYGPLDRPSTRPDARSAWVQTPDGCPIGPSISAPDVLATLMAMSAAEHLSLADVKNRLSEVIDRLEREHGRVVVTKHGRPAAVMLSVEDLESLEETLEILSDPKLLDEIRRGERDVETGRTVRLSRDELVARRAGK